MEIGFFHRVSEVIGDELFRHVVWEGQVADVGHHILAFIRLNAQCWYSWMPHHVHEDRHVAYFSGVRINKRGTFHSR